MIDRYITAAEWGLDCRSRGIALQGGNLPYCFIHHTAGQTPDLSVQTWDDDPIAWVRFLDKIATQTKGYKALDYSWLFHRAPNGIVSCIEGRGRFFPAATLDMNSVSKALCFAGSFGPAGDPITTEREPHPDELAACGELLGELFADGTLAPHALILGHRDNPAHPQATSCPGDWLYRALPTIDPRLTTPPTPPEEDDMQVIELVRPIGTPATYAVYGTEYDKAKGRGQHKVWVPTGGDAGVEALARVWGISSIPRDIDQPTCSALGPVLGEIPEGYDSFGWRKS